MATQTQLSFQMEPLESKSNSQLSELTEERTIMVYHPHALSFTELKTNAGSVIIINKIIEPSNIEFQTKFRSSVDVNRLISSGDLVCKVNDNLIEANISLHKFEILLNNEFKNSKKNKPINITILKTATQRKTGKLQHAKTVKNALKWKAEQEARYKDPRNILKRHLDSIYVQLFIFILIVLDLTLFAVGEIKSVNISTRTTAGITFTILAIYVIEIILRIYAMRAEIFFKDPLEVLDLIVVIASLILNLVEYSTISIFVRAARSLRAFRVLRIFRSFRLCVRTTKTIRHTPASIRQVVRLNKQGYHDDEFDLDLCYITQHVIAMSLPSTGFEKYYRNPIKDVVKFMDQHHSDHYMIFDLCLERSYDHRVFHNRVTHYKFQDHGVPTIRNMYKLCNGIAEWLDRHNDNCVAIHCKGGKGRTGTMICAWLLYRYSDATPSEAIDLFATMRTNHIKSNQYQGIETYSQRRYVEYFYEFIKNPKLLQVPPYKSIKIYKISVGPLYNKVKHNHNDHQDDDDLMDTEWVIRIIQRDESSDDNPQDKVYPFAQGIINPDNNTITFNNNNNDLVKLNGNICVLIVKQSNPEPIIFASFWIHSYFIKFNNNNNNNKQELIIPKLECDKLHKDKTHKKTPKNMCVKLQFNTYTDDKL